MKSDDNTYAKLKTEMANTNVTISFTGEEILSLIAMAQLAYISNPALGELGECGKLAAQKIQGALDPNSLLAQHLSEGWVSKDYGNPKLVNYIDYYEAENFGSESFSL